MRSRLAGPGFLVAQTSDHHIPDRFTEKAVVIADRSERRLRILSKNNIVKAGHCALLRNGNMMFAQSGKKTDRAQIIGRNDRIRKFFLLSNFHFKQQLIYNVL